MTPNKNRYELIGRLIEEYQIDGVVEMTLQACHTYNVEAKSIEKFVKGKGVPYIHVETDYSQEDIGQLNTRMTAFVEMKRHLWHLHIYMCIRNTVCWMDLVRLKSFCQEQKNLEWIASLLQIMESCMV